MSTLHKFTWSTSDWLHPDIFAVGGWRLWQDSEAEEGEQADADPEDWEFLFVSFQFSVNSWLGDLSWGYLHLEHFPKNPWISKK